MTIAEELEKKGLEKGETRTKSALSGLIRRIRIKFNNSDEAFKYIDEFVTIFDYDDLDKYEEVLEKAETLEEFKRMVWPMVKLKI